MVGAERTDPEFVHGVDQAPDVVCDELAEYLVPLGRLRLASDVLVLC
jgi:hypothetical protein